MSHPGSPIPDFDPYFVPAGKAPKGVAKGVGPGDEDVRLDLLRPEGSFRVAGTIGMVLGAAVFVVFAVPVSSMLRGAAEPDGLFQVEDWLWRRWLARMVSVLTLSVVASTVGWGLRRRRRWARWALIGLGCVPLLAMASGIALRGRSVDPALRAFFADVAWPCVGLVVFPPSLVMFRAAFSRRGRAVLGPDHDDLVARTPWISPGPRTGLLAGLGLALAMLILYWMLLLWFLGMLAAFGVIRSI